MKFVGPSLNHHSVLVSNVGQGLANPLPRPRDGTPMKIKKTVTEAVLAANRASSRLAKGRKTARGKAASSRSSLRHGLLARAVFFDSDEKRAAYEQHWRSWHKHWKPVGPVELFLMEDITNISWKLAIEEALETEELAHRQSEGIDGVFANDLDLPMDATDLPLSQSYVCEKVSIEAVASKGNVDSGGSSAPKLYEGRFVQNTRQSTLGTYHHTGQLGVHAVLSNSLDALVRYRSGLKRDLHRALGTLRSLQAERLEQQSDDGSF